MVKIQGNMICKLIHKKRRQAAFTIEEDECICIINDDDRERREKDSLFYTS